MAPRSGRLRREADGYGLPARSPERPRRRTDAPQVPPPDRQGPVPPRPIPPMPPRPPVRSAYGPRGPARADAARASSLATRGRRRRPRRPGAAGRAGPRDRRPAADHPVRGRPDDPVRLTGRGAATARRDRRRRRAHPRGGRAGRRAVRRRARRAGCRRPTSPRRPCRAPSRRRCRCLPARCAVPGRCPRGSARASPAPARRTAPRSRCKATVNTVDGPRRALRHHPRLSRPGADVTSARRAPRPGPGARSRARRRRGRRPSWAP